MVEAHHLGPSSRTKTSSLPQPSNLFSPSSAPHAASEMALALTNNFLRGNPAASVLPKKKVSGARNCRAVISCRKKDIHPEFYEESKVYCNGDLVMTTGGTKKEYSVDVWSGNHPFYLGSRSALMVNDDQVEKFRKKYGALSEIMKIPVLKGEIVLPTKRKSGGKGGKKK